MGRGARVARIILWIAGWLAMLSGLAIVVLAAFWVWPRLSGASEELAAELRVADKTLTAPSQRAFLESAVKDIHDGSKVLALTPNLFLTAKGSLEEAAMLLDSAGKTAKAATHGLIGLVAPDQPLRRDKNILRKTASQLRLTASTLESMGSASRGIARDATRFSRRLETIPVSSIIQRAHQQIQHAHEMVTGTRIPVYASLLCAGFGGLCFLIGICAVSLALILEKTLRLRATGVSDSGISEDRKRQAA